MDAVQVQCNISKWKSVSEGVDNILYSVEEAQRDRAYQDCNISKSNA
jgi:hypothetical protein